MLKPGARALDREQALRVLADLQAAQRERDELRVMLAERDGPFEQEELLRLEAPANPS